MPDKDCDSWYYPFPVPNIQDTTLPFTPEQTPYIFCKTSKARLWAHQAGDGNNLELHKESGRKIGVLNLHNQEQLEVFPKILASGAQGKLIELVAIYRSTIYSKTWDKTQERYTYPLNIEERYQVLCVEWKEQVACRLAGGHIEKAGWEELDLEEVSLILA